MRWLMSSFAVGGLLVGSVACGTAGSAGSGSASAASVVDAAYTRTIAANSAHIRMVETVHASSSAGSSQALTVTGEGVADFGRRVYSVQVNAPSGGTVELRVLGSLLYIRVPQAAVAGVPGHKPWVEIDLDQVAKARTGQSFQQLESLGDADPLHALSYLKGVSSAVTRQGTAQVDGVTTTRYRALVDLNRQVAGATPRVRMQVQQLETLLGTHLLPVEVWVDGSGLVHQLSTETPIPAASAGASRGSGVAQLTMTFSDFGAPVAVSAPPAGQTANLTALATGSAPPAPSAPTTQKASPAPSA